MSIRFLCIAFTALPALIGMAPTLENSFGVQSSSGALEQPVWVLGPLTEQEGKAKPNAQAEVSEAPEEDPPEEDPKVATEILFDVQSFIPGKTAHLVVVLNVPKDWHIYWETAGESGMSTSLTVTGPKGWEIGNPHFPGPMLYEDGQGNLNHVMEGEMGFFVPITPPDDAKPGEVAEFQVKMQWLQCQEICLMGTLEEQVQLEIGKGTAKRNPDRRLVPMRNRLPRRGMIPADIGYAFGGDADEAEIAFSTRDARTFEFFTLPDSPMALDRRDEGSESTTFSQRNFALKPTMGGELEAIEVQGVLRVQRKDHIAYFEIALQGPQTRAPKKQALGHGSLPTVPRKK